MGEAKSWLWVTEVRKAGSSEIFALGENGEPGHTLYTIAYLHKNGELMAVRDQWEYPSRRHIEVKTRELQQATTKAKSYRRPAWACRASVLVKVHRNPAIVAKTRSSPLWTKNSNTRDRSGRPASSRSTHCSTCPAPTSSPSWFGEQDLLSAAESTAPRLVSAPIPAVGTSWPVIRTNALPVVEYPSRVRRLRDG